MMARTGDIRETLERSGSGDRLARADRARAAPITATRAALDERTKGWNVNTVLIHESFPPCRDRRSDPAHSPNGATSARQKGAFERSRLKRRCNTSTVEARP
jgi:hypothetical protein